MGCVSSKHLKQQAAIDAGWTSPGNRSTNPRTQTITANYSVECYHRHFVSLTSTSYGSLKVESPKPAGARLTHDQAAFTSLNQMYGKLRTLEMADSAQINSGFQSTFQSCIRRSPSQLDAEQQCSSLRSFEMVNSAHQNAPLCSANRLQNAFGPWVTDNSSPQSTEGQQWAINSAELARPETINVKEMMMGLEEAAPSHSPPPAKRATSTTGTPKAMKETRDLTKKTGRKSSILPATEWSHGEQGLGKENASPYHSHQVMHQPTRSTTTMRSPMGETPLSQVSDLSASSAWQSASRGPMLKPLQRTPKSTASMENSEIIAESAREFQPMRRGSVIARREAIERGSPCNRGIHISKLSSPGLSSASSASARSVQYEPANGKVKLSLQAQLGNSASPMVSTPPNPSRSMSRRQAMGGGGGLASSAKSSSSPTFDPDLVASYEKALKTVSQGDWNAGHTSNISKGSKSKFSVATTVKAEAGEGGGGGGGGRAFFWSTTWTPTAELDKNLYDPLQSYAAKCPPGGERAVVLYTTTLRGIRKTFEDCNSAREILQSSGVSIDERDVSMHLEFLKELRELMGRVVSVPRVFIKGHYIGGIDEVVKLHDAGGLAELVDGLPKQINGGGCDGCGGIRFVPCLECSGSCKIRIEEEDDRVIRCPDCNENGLIQCPICT